MTVSATERTRVVGQPSAALLALCVAALLGGAIALAIWRDRAFPPALEEEAILYVQSGPVVQHLALSFDAVLADVYWIRALQHYGGERRSTAQTKHYELLNPLLSLAVSLDPLFNIVYRFGSIFLAEPPPGGPGRADQAIALLKRGLVARPGNWRYMQDIGFVYYWWLHDFKSAADWFERGAQQPGAPFFLRSLAATTLAQGGDRQASRILWQLLSQSDNEWLQHDAQRRLQQLDALDRMDALQTIVNAAIKNGLPTPYSWDALARAGYLRGVPADPVGMAFELGPWSGQVRVAEESPLQPMPAEPPRGPNP